MPKSEVVTCGRCGGKGFIIEGVMLERVTCPVCKGKGQVRV